MSKKFYKLDDIANFTNINNFFKLEASPNTMDSAIAPVYVLWTEEMFEDVFEQNCEKSIYIHETNDAWGKFKNLYTQWVARNKTFIANEMDALSQKYNPIENYNRYEEHSGEDVNTKAPDEWVQTTTETPDDYKVTTTQTPTNWVKENNRSYDNYHETLTDTPDDWVTEKTDTPTNWIKENNRSYDDYHETATDTPTNWETTKTDTPTNWVTEKTDTPNNWRKEVAEEYEDYKETEIQTPNGWTQETSKLSINNGGNVNNKVVPFEATEPELVSQTESSANENTATEQKGIFETSKAIEGRKTVTETQDGSYTSSTEQSGTFQTVTEQSGTFEHDKTITGSETITEEQKGTYTSSTEQSGTFEHDKTITGSETITEEQKGTFTSSTEQSGTFEHDKTITGSETITEEQKGTFKTEVEESGSKVITNEQSGEMVDTTAYGHIIETKGNVGVTTSQQMIASSLELYSHDFVYRWLMRFFDSCCVYV